MLSNKINYSPDILNGFEQLKIDMPNDYEGKVVTTLIRKLCLSPSNKAVLYIHGFLDYFFQEELAAQFNEQGYNFYAIDLRKSGRSLLAHQIPYNLRNIDEYFMDINAAIQQIKHEGNEVLLINAHSTGGLAASLYLNKYKDSCNALILNSPFLEMNKSWWIRKIGIPIVCFISKLHPKLKLKVGFSPFYGESVNKNYRGEWEYNLKWKPIHADYVIASWTAAIHNAHKAIKHKLSISCPILVMSSDKSVKSKIWIDEFKKADAVLNVKDIQKYAYYLGDNITTISFKDGLHDLILSEKPVRTKVYSTMFSWLDENLKKQNPI